MQGKILSRLLFAIYLCFSLNRLSAQPPQFQRQLNNISFNNQMRMQNQMMMQMSSLNRGYADYNISYTFVVTMKDGTKKEVDSKIYNDTIVKKNYLLLVDKSFKRSDTNRYKKIYPAQTISIARNVAAPGDVIHKNAVQPPPVYFKGMPSDSCWMFKVVAGPISAYSYLSEQEDDQVFNPYAVVAIQLNDGPLMPLTDENLKQMVGQDINALEDIQKKNYFRAIKKYNKDVEKAAKK